MDAAFHRAQAAYDAMVPDYLDHEDEPSLEELEEMASEGVATATDGCIVEPDGICQHGAESWLIALGWI